MNIYYKFAPNVFLAKCTEKHEKGETIAVTTKYGKENESIIFNLIAEKNGYFYYSIVRADGFNVQEWAKKKAEKYQTSAQKAEQKSNEFYKKSNDAVSGIVAGQPILVGHHSEKRHRRDLNKSWNAMGKSVAESKKAEIYQDKANYWEQKQKDINLSMPESIEYYEFLLKKAKAKHEAIKSGKVERRHSYSLTYAKKEVNEIEKKLKLARQLWGD
jgi:hypothetical protein